MKYLKKIVINISVIGLLLGSLSLYSCSSGAASPLGGNVPTPTATLETIPVGYTLSTTGSNPTTVYTSYDLSNILNSLGLSQGPNASPVFIQAPAGISGTTFLSAIVQQFNLGIPIVLVASATSASGLVVNMAQNSVFTAAQNASIKVLSPTDWTQFGFNGVTGTSTPIATAVFNLTDSNIYIGTNINPGGSFLAQGMANESMATPVANATPSACSANASSTSASAIAATTLADGSNVIAIGTNFGEVMIYGVSGTNANQCQNITSASKAQAAYAPSSPIIAISYTSLNSSNYGYFATQNGQVWRVVANSSNTPQSFTQIAGSNSSFIGLPSGQLTALFSDNLNNVYVGSQNGTVYTLAPTNSSGVVNIVWTHVTLSGGPVLSISETANGNIIATTSAGVFNISFNGSD